MKNNLLNTLIQISLNGPLVHKGADNLITKKTVTHVTKGHYKEPKCYSERSVSNSSTQTDAIKILIDSKHPSIQVSRLEDTPDINQNNF